MHHLVPGGCGLHRATRLQQTDDDTHLKQDKKIAHSLRFPLCALPLHATMVPFCRLTWSTCSVSRARSSSMRAEPVTLSKPVRIASRPAATVGFECNRRIRGCCCQNLSVSGQNTRDTVPAPPAPHVGHVTSREGMNQV